MQGREENAQVSEEWYRGHARRYSEVAHDFLQSVFVKHSHPDLTDEYAVFDRLLELVPGRIGLDLGCGAGARDVARLTEKGYDVTGVDSIEENIALAVEQHPNLNGKVSVHDLGNPLPFADESFDFAYCDSVLQHLTEAEVYETLLPEAARVLRSGGVLQLLFKAGNGIETVLDPQYNEERSFRLFDPTAVAARLGELGMVLVEPGANGEMGGVMLCADHRDIDIAVLWARKA